MTLNRPYYAVFMRLQFLSSSDFILTKYLSSAMEESLSADDFDNLTLTKAVSLIQSRRITSETLVREAIKRALSYSELNAITFLDENGAVEAAQVSDKRSILSRPLEGVPIIIKDNIHVFGLPNSAGTPGLRNFIPLEDAEVVKKLRNAGAIILAKGNMHELAFGISGYNPTFQTGKHVGVRNAYDISRIAGGSSSGNGAALGARIVTSALGTDTGGSVRIPAALNGIAALRPTMGRYSQKGITPVSFTKDTVGPMAQTVADLELLDRVITEQPEVAAAATLKGVRLGIARYFMAEMDDDTAQFMNDVRLTLQNAGIELIDVEMPNLADSNSAIELAIVIYEQYDGLVSYLKEYCPEKTIEQLAEDIISPDVHGIYSNWILPRKLPVADGSLTNAAPFYEQAIQKERPALQKLYRDVFALYRLDGLIYPTVPRVAVKANFESSNVKNFAMFTQNTKPGSNAGIPSLNIPVTLGKKTNLPMSIGIDGPENGDRRLLSLGMALEMLFVRLSAPKFRNGGNLR